ncbi:hypothetical protein [Leptospira kanakyensis]|uniref:hypothetical protein n=1 Tax=Leptospira kanakyensis TaxID=2484968 RepID=UPI00223CE044|nr:hypothetical protein [Leptospira kanakyensis]MCW7471736.1 hypothetical protein [Leptospira kanakyensis]
MKNIQISITVFLTLISINCNKVQNTNFVMIKEGIGIEKVIVGKTTFNDIVLTYGKEYNKINHLNYSYEINYSKLGLAFYYKYADKTKTIYAIKLKSPFNARTHKGIALGRSKMEDVISIYGPPKWRTTEKGKTWWNEYKGIEFHVEKDKSLPEFPLNEGIHIKKTIIQIDIESKNNYQNTLF